MQPSRTMETEPLHTGFTMRPALIHSSITWPKTRLLALDQAQQFIKTLSGRKQLTLRVGRDEVATMLGPNCCVRAGCGVRTQSGSCRRTLLRQAPRWGRFTLAALGRCLRAARGTARPSRTTNWQVVDDRWRCR